jgi:hypothetical protein
MALKLTDGKRGWEQDAQNRLRMWDCSKNGTLEMDERLYYILCERVSKLSIKKLYTL